MPEPAVPVVTRIAPSPTGMMHIGTARAALFNWLYARHTGGKFLIRIEDTDRERSTPEAVEAIFDGMDWLGLTSDAEPIFQFTRGVAFHPAPQKFCSWACVAWSYFFIDSKAPRVGEARSASVVGMNGKSP